MKVLPADKRRTLEAAFEIFKEIRDCPDETPSGRRATTVAISAMGGITHALSYFGPPETVKQQPDSPEPGFFQEFWMVLGQNGVLASETLDSEETADTEAKMYAQSNPGRTFTIMKAVRAVEQPTSLIVREAADMTDMPF